MSVTLPRGYLSYSSFSLWRNNKNEFRKKYYHNETTFDTPEMIFGKKIADVLESRDFSHFPQLNNIPMLPISEHPVEVEIDGIRIIGRLDMFDDSNNSFYEFKTGKTLKNGNPPWNKLLVQKHDQLPFYSLLLKKKYGSVENLCHLVWLETQFMKKTSKFDGYVLEGQSRDLELTGVYKVFPRTIKEWERKRMKDMIRATAEEIHEDYAKYR